MFGLLLFYSAGSKDICSASWRSQGGRSQGLMFGLLVVMVQEARTYVRPPGGLKGVGVKDLCSGSSIAWGGDPRRTSKG